MLGARLDGGGKLEQLVLRDGTNRNNAVDTLTTLRESAGLVEQDHGHEAGILEGGPTAHQDAATCAKRGIARPSAWGQAMTRTVTTLSRTKFGSVGRIRTHTTAVITAAAIAT
jgi:hypothetical protein